MPVNWYASLVLIVVLGVGSVFLARYHYTHTSAGAQPTVGQTWHAAVAFDICGTTEPALAASPQSTTDGLTTTGKGVLLIAPKTSSESGGNATLGKFASEYTGLTLSDTKVKYPGTTVPEYTNGAKCAKGSPDAGKKGVLRVRSWVLSTSTAKSNEVKPVGGAYASKPAGLKLLNRQEITVAFVPSGTSVPKPPGTTTLALIQAISGTTAPVTTTVPPATVPTTTATTVKGATTTTTAPAAATTTTAPASTTTTTAPASTTTTTSKK